MGKAFIEPTGGSKGEGIGNSGGFDMENPFSFKFGQVFTGFGFGCGVGIGVGRPIYLGAIPALQQVLTATKGATDMLSGAGRHVNRSMRRFGVKGIEAGVGCGVGIGHGFGVGITVKPSAIQRIHLSLGHAIMKIITNLGMGSAIPSLQTVIPGTLHSSPNAQNQTIDQNLQSYNGNSLQISENNTGTLIGLKNDESFQAESKNISDLNETSSENPVISRTEKVISSFLQDPVLKNEKPIELNELAENLRSENNALQVLVNHQQMIEKLVKENANIREILRNEFRVSPSRLEVSEEKPTTSSQPCAPCFECRRRRKSMR